MSIRLSDKYGVNPSLELCDFCQKEKGTIVLPGKLLGDVPAPRFAVWNKEPCDECKGWMEKGIVLISTRDGESGGNPYRTGGWTVITEAAIRRMLKPGQVVEEICQKRVAFLEDKTWDALGLPRGEKEEEPASAQDSPQG